MHKYQSINSKDIYIVESHHHILLAWSYIRRASESAPNLITLDHHTDTMPAFNWFRCGGDSYDISVDYSLAPVEPLIEAIDWYSDESILSAINKLKYDEHIHTATLAGIIKYGFAINLTSQTPSIEQNIYYEERASYMKALLAGKSQKEFLKPVPPFTYQATENFIFEISASCAIGCEKVPHDDDCVIVRSNQVLESFYLNHEIHQANEMAKSVGLTSIEAVPYILDIDLDYFHSEQAVNPQNVETFYRLIKNSEAITIAMEHSCVEELKMEGSQITSDYLLERVLEHISAATS